jgi:hypothetical protein
VVGRSADLQDYFAGDVAGGEGALCLGGLLQREDGADAYGEQTGFGQGGDC